MKIVRVENFSDSNLFLDNDRELLSRHYQDNSRPSRKGFDFLY